MFTAAEEERLIDAVRSFPILYNRTPKTNENSGEKEACWNRISQFVGKDVTECKARWRNLRDSYTKTQKKMAPGSSSNLSKYCTAENLTFLKPYLRERKPPSSPSSKYSATDNSRFLNPYLKDRKSQTSSSNSVIDGTEPLGATAEQLYDPSTEMDVFYEYTTYEDADSTAVKPKKRRLTRDKTATINEVQEGLLNILNSIGQTNRKEHSIFSFMRSMGDIIVSFPPHKIREVRSKIYSIVSEMEAEAGIANELGGSNG